MTTKSEAASAVVEVFMGLPPEVAEALLADASPFLADVGAALLTGRTLGPLFIAEALDRVTDDDRAGLVHTLSTAAPWGSLRDALLAEDAERYEIASDS